MMKRAVKIVVSVLIVSLVSILFFSSTGWAQLLKRDDFRDHKSWWSWESVGGGLYPSVQNGTVLLRINSGTSSGPSDSAIWDGANVYSDCTITLRAKTLTPMQPGTLGWGFWNYVPPWYSFDIARSNIAWFMKQYDPFDPARTWWGYWTRNASTGLTNYGDLSQVDISQWHVYKIERRNDHVAFYIDGNLVGHYDNNLPEGLLAFHLWIDNYNYPFDPHQPIIYRAFNTPTALVVDFIEIHIGPLGTSIPPEGSVLLKETPNETGDGRRDYLWKEYSFQSPGGEECCLGDGKSRGLWKLQ